MSLQRVLVMASAFVPTLAVAIFAQPPAPEASDPAALVAVLEKPDAPVFAKAKACQRLAIVGTKESVPALAALLSHETLATYARTGLEGIPDAAADEALRNAADRLEGRPLVGVINSIGQRKDQQAVGQLRKLLGHDDAAVVAAAAGSIGQIAPREAAEALTGALADAPDKKVIADACLIAAENQASAGRKDEAVALYQAVARAEVPSHVRADAVLGQIRLLKAEARDLLLEQIRAEDETFFNLGLAMAREVPGAAVTQALTAELDKLPPERKALLLLALGDRREAVSLELLASARRSESAAVREAAVRVLAKSEDPDALAMLVDTAFGDDETARSARESLKRHPGREVDAMLLGRLDRANRGTKIVLFDLIGARRIEAAQPAVTSALAEGDETVRAAALAALAQIVDLDGLSLLVSRARAAGSPKDTTAAREALATAALRIGDREACAAQLAGTLADAPADYQVYVLELLGKLGGQKALDAVVAAAGSGDAAIKDAATRVLGEWPHAEAAPALLKIAKDDSEARYRIRALRGYLRIARQLQLSEEDRLGMFRSAMEIAQRDDERKLALDILTRIPSPQTLELAVSYLGQPALKDAAADAAVKIAPRVIGTQPKAVAGAMQKVIDAGVGGEVGARSRQLLEQAQGSGT
ncbi:MAG TPA: HEAT repeat domain-containing protein [Planctomycetaceae bacterium]|nr:HEAT repeat domain-containing protein [Planctomycetaceae bacterium]